MFPGDVKMKARLERKFSFVVNPRKLIVTNVLICKLRSSQMLIIGLIFSLSPQMKVRPYGSRAFNSKSTWCFDKTAVILLFIMENYKGGVLALVVKKKFFNSNHLIPHEIQFTLFSNFW